MDNGDVGLDKLMTNLMRIKKLASEIYQESTDTENLVNEFQQHRALSRLAIDK
jgi:hypothetical protein